MPKPLETIFKKDVQKLLDHFCACFDIRILFYSPTGEELRVGLNRSDSSYCALVQKHLYGESACLEMDQAKRQEASAKQELLCYQCHAGLVEAIKPIYRDTTLLGFVAIGQLRPKDILPEIVAQDWRKARGGDELEQAYRLLPLVDEDKIDHILGLLSVLVDYIVMQKMVVLKGDVVLQEIVSYVEDHLHEPISLDDVARLVHKSPSTVSHLFRSKTNRSFKRTITEMRLAKAEEHMALDPDATVSEAAAKVGYADPLYFSRIYRRHRGVPPSDFLKHIRGAVSS